MNAKKIKEIIAMRDSIVHGEGRADIELAVSSRQRNELGGFLLRRHIAEGLTRPSVETALNCLEVFGGVLQQIGALCHVLAEQPLGVLD